MQAAALTKETLKLYSKGEIDKMWIMRKKRGTSLMLKKKEQVVITRTINRGSNSIKIMAMERKECLL